MVANFKRETVGIFHQYDQISRKKEKISQRKKMHTKKGHTKKRKRSIISILLIVFLCLCLFAIFDGKSVVKADEPPTDIKYKIIKVGYNDSLWSIAKENMPFGYLDIYEYIYEIKKCNGLHSDQITSGCYLMIPYDQEPISSEK